MGMKVVDVLFLASVRRNAIAADIPLWYSSYSSVHSVSQPPENLRIGLTELSAEIFDLIITPQCFLFFRKAQLWENKLRDKGLEVRFQKIPRGLRLDTVPT
jgi:hypothetical protein